MSANTADIMAWQIERGCGNVYIAGKLASDKGGWCQPDLSFVLELSLPLEPEAGSLFVCTWAQDERPADLHMAQPNACASE
jgi:hypothetical protein